MNYKTLLKERDKNIRIRMLWLRLTGSSQVFPLESRIFHSISIGLILLGVFYIPYNLFAGLYIAAVSCAIISSIFFYQYYQSRFHSKAHNSIVFGLTGILIFSVNYFSNAGINGSTNLIWPAYLLLVFAISPYRQHIVWLIVYLLTFLLVHLVEYYYPSLVKHPFAAGKGTFIDRVTAFPIPVIAIYVIIQFIRRSYDKEKRVAEERDVEKNRLMSIISHDFRAPLINIQNYLEMLNKSELTNYDRPMLEKSLLTATDNTMEMLSNLLYWSKSQMEGHTIRIVETDLFTVLQNTLEMGKMQAAQKDIALHYPTWPPITVMADIDMLQLVVRNLISNAIKFTPQGGVIHIDAHPVLHECKITVVDNGKGIEPGKQEKLFSIHSTPAFGTNNERGVGLGLLLCKEFIEQQGGRIGFESIPGQGSNFFIFIPLRSIA